MTPRRGGQVPAPTGPMPRDVASWHFRDITRGSAHVRSGGPRQSCNGDHLEGRIRPPLNRSSQDKLRFVTTLATSCAQSMKSWATGLSVRFFSVMMPMGRRVVGKSIGKTLSATCPDPNLTLEL